MAAVPIGAFIGFFLAGEICSMVLHLQGRGESHADVFPVVGAAVFGLLAGAIASPILTWIVLNRGRK
jgi:hypothetical protein